MPLDNLDSFRVHLKVIFKIVQRSISLWLQTLLLMVIAILISLESMVCSVGGSQNLNVLLWSNFLWLQIYFYFGRLGYYSVVCRYLIATLSFLIVLVVCNYSRT